MVPHFKTTSQANALRTGLLQRSFDQAGSFIGRRSRLPAIGTFLAACLLTISTLQAQSQNAPEPPRLMAIDGVPLAAADWSSVHDFTGLPLDSNGWTDLHTLVMTEGRYADARIVYVSSSSGNDNTGAVYSKDSTSLGGQPFNPTGAIQPFATIGAAASRLRSGYPDIMLLRRGDEWDHTDGTTISDPKRGRGPEERTIWAAYGDVTAERPVIHVSREQITSLRDDGSSFLILAHWHFEYDLGRGNDPTDDGAIRFQGYTQHLLVEGLKFNHFGRYPVLIQRPNNSSPAKSQEIALRRNVIYDTYSGAVFLKNLEALLVEENIIDTVGMRWAAAGNDSNVAPQTLYIQYDNVQPVVVRGNIMARMESSAIQIRPGGLVEHNLVIQAATGIGVWNGNYAKAVRVNRNLILEGTDQASGPRGRAIFGDSHIDSMEIIDNIIVDSSKSDATNTYGIMLGASADSGVVSGNIVYNWRRSLRLHRDIDYSGLRIFENLFHSDSGPAASSQATGPNSPELRRNRYHVRGTSVADFFSPGGSYNQWQIELDDEDGVILESESDVWNISHGASPDIRHYNQTLGGSLSLDDFLSNARQQRFGRWRDDLTVVSIYAWFATGFGKHTH